MSVANNQVIRANADQNLFDLGIYPWGFVVEIPYVEGMQAGDEFVLEALRGAPEVAGEVFSASRSVYENGDILRVCVKGGSREGLLAHLEAAMVADYFILMRQERDHAGWEIEV